MFAEYESWKQTALKGDAQAITFFDGLKDALLATVERGVMAYVDSKIQPLQEGHTGFVADGFFKANSWAEPRRAEIEAAVKQFPGMKYEQAARMLGIAPPAQRPSRIPPPGAKPGMPGAPSNLKDLPKGKGLGPIVEAVMASKGL
jgi:hypothetical protein